MTTTSITLRKGVENKIRANARRGARKLDSIAPDWYKSQYLKLNRLNMRSACQCVWGQLSGYDKFSNNEKFEEAFGVLNGPGTPGYVPAYNKDDEGDCHVDERAQYHRHYTFNFTREEAALRDAVGEAEWAILEDEWKSLIRIRRNAAKVAA